jgi:exodeoxyribonuclease (lambda-induced)
MRFPDCKLIDCAQKSPEWFEARKGYLTASQFGDWLTKFGKVAEKAQLTAASRCLADLFGVPDPSPFETDDMRRGTEMEPLAREEFAKLTGMAVDEIGFAKSKHGFFGCSPDGIMENGEGLEIKCPRPSKLIQYHELGELPDEYKAQVHGSMAVTGAKAWHFYAAIVTENDEGKLAVSKAIPAFHIVVKRDTYTDSMFEGLKSYSNYYERLAAKIFHLKLEGGE